VSTRETKDFGGVKHYRCGKCRIFMQASGFGGSKTGLDGLDSRCKACRSKANRASRTPEQRKDGAIIYERVLAKRHRPERREKMQAWQNGWTPDDGRPW